jgi:hypothetical protein
MGFGPEAAACEAKPRPAKQTTTELNKASPLPFLGAASPTSEASTRSTRSRSASVTATNYEYLSASGTLVPVLLKFPTAVQAVADVHDTPLKVVGMAGLRVDWTDQLVPFQPSASDRYAECESEK